jgi:5-formyltetrahydrofolate cyclo-ligase
LSRAATASAKQLLRQRLLRQRDRQTRADLTTATKRIQQHLHDWLHAQPPATICAFAGTRNEINLLPLLAHLQQSGWRTALPRIDSDRPGIMHMHLWPADDPLQHNRYGIPEPASDCAQMASDAIDICLLPLLAFTDHGDRLGMGGGYYDRWLPQATPAMLRVGVACAWQRQTNLPLDQWDQSMHYVCTESGLHRCVQDR